MRPLSAAAAITRTSLVHHTRTITGTTTSTITSSTIIHLARHHRPSHRTVTIVTKRDINNQTLHLITGVREEDF